MGEKKKLEVLTKNEVAYSIYKQTDLTTKIMEKISFKVVEKNKKLTYRPPSLNKWKKLRAEGISH